MDRKRQQHRGTDAGHPDQREASELGVWPPQMAPGLVEDTRQWLCLEETQDEHLKFPADGNPTKHHTKRKRKHSPAPSVNCPNCTLVVTRNGSYSKSRNGQNQE